MITKVELWVNFGKQNYFTTCAEHEIKEKKDIICLSVLDHK